MRKAQLSIEFLLLLMTIVIMAVIFFYFYNKATSSSNTNLGIIFNNFQINSYSTSANTCEFNFSFQATSSNFESLPITILTENSTDSLINISINSTYFSVSSYPLSDNFYQYEYNLISSSSYPFNSPICNEFTQYQSSMSGKIIGISALFNGKGEVFKFSNPIPMYSS